MSVLNFCNFMGVVILPICPLAVGLGVTNSHQELERLQEEEIRKEGHGRGEEEEDQFLRCWDDLFLFLQFSMVTFLWQ